MDRTLLFAAAAALLCLRDARLLASRPRLGFGFAASVIVAAAACGMLAETLSAAEARGWLADPRFWLPAAATHAALAAWAGVRSLRSKGADWLSLAPVPVWAVAATGTARLALVRIDGVDGVWVGAGLGVAYCLAVGAILAVGRLRGDARSALRFAVASHVSAVLLIPAAAALDRPFDVQAVDVRATAWVLAGTLLAIGSSFLWHRFRNRSGLTAKSR